MARAHFDVQAKLTRTRGNCPRDSLIKRGERHGNKHNAIAMLREITINEIAKVEAPNAIHVGRLEQKKLPRTVMQDRANAIFRLGRG